MKRILCFLVGVVWSDVTAFQSTPRCLLRISALTVESGDVERGSGDEGPGFLYIHNEYKINHGMTANIL